MLDNRILMMTKLERHVEQYCDMRDVVWKTALTELANKTPYSRRDICAAMRFIGRVPMPQVKRLPLCTLGDSALRRPIVRAINCGHDGMDVQATADKLNMEPALVREIWSRFDGDISGAKVIEEASVNSILQKIRASTRAITAIISPDQARLIAGPADMLDVEGAEALGDLIGVYDEATYADMCDDIAACLADYGLESDATWGDLAKAADVEIDNTVTDARKELAYRMRRQLGIETRVVGLIVGVPGDIISEMLRERRCA